MLSDKTPPNPSDTVRPLGLGLVLVATVAATSLRLMPYVPGFQWLFNITIIGALALFGGARLRSWQAFVVPLLAMALSDLVLRATIPFSILDRLPVYTSFVIYVLLGRTLLSRTESPWRIGGVALLGSLQFFLITNFTVWAASSVDPAVIPDGAAWMKVTEPGYEWTLTRYANNISGLVACYVLALPFAWKTVVSDLGFTALLFGAHAWLSRAVFARERVLVPGNRSVEKV